MACALPCRWEALPARRVRARAAAIAQEGTHMKTWLRAVLCGFAITAASAACAAGAAAATHHPIYMPGVSSQQSSALAPPPVELPPVCVTSPATSACVPYQLPPAGQPTPVNMAYFGGHVQTAPRIYLVFWGWGESGAFSKTP